MKLSELSPKPVPQLDEIFIASNTHAVEVLHEGTWISGRFDNNIRIDQPTHLHGDGKKHAHVYGRKGNELGSINLDGTPSHGSIFKLHDKDAEALRARGFSIPADNLVEWIILGKMPKFLNG